jgi:putative ABC transport system substrate-binding protein
MGLVVSLNRPGGNLTGFNGLNSQLGPKGLALLHELVPSARVIGFLENPRNPLIHELVTRDVLAAAAALGVQLQVLQAGTDHEIDIAFESLAQARIGALLVADDYYLNNKMEQMSALAARYTIPVMHASPEFVAAGGFISYGLSLVETYRPVGVYAGRILKGEKPANLPVIQTTKFELAINLKTAKALGLDVPPSLLARADERCDRFRMPAIRSLLGQIGHRDRAKMERMTQFGHWPPKSAVMHNTPPA